MNFPFFFDDKNTLNLFGLNKEFLFLSNLYKKNKLPKILLFTGNKGTGKSTLIKHFLYSIFDEKNYSKENLKLIHKSSFYKQFKNDIFTNIIIVKGSDFKSVKVDDIRNLKKKIFQSTILNKDRFIILDDVELFNINSLNGLLKIIEEPGRNNYFFLINNKSKPLLETIKSRSLEIKIILNEKKRIEIINSLINFFNLDLILDPVLSKLSPGNFIKFNHVLRELDISISDDLTKNLSILLTLYKKDKDILFIDLAFFIVDYYFKNINEKQNFKNIKIYEMRNFIFDNLNNFLLYNLNQNSVINSINNRFKYE